MLAFFAFFFFVDGKGDSDVKIALFEHGEGIQPFVLEYPLPASELYSGLRVIEAHHAVFELVVFMKAGPRVVGQRFNAPQEFFQGDWIQLGFLRLGRNRLFWFSRRFGGRITEESASLEFLGLFFAEHESELPDDIQKEVVHLLDELPLSVPEAGEVDQVELLAETDALVDILHFIDVLALQNQIYLLYMVGAEEGVGELFLGRVGVEALQDLIGGVQVLDQVVVLPVEVVSELLEHVEAEVLGVDEGRVLDVNEPRVVFGAHVAVEGSFHIHHLLDGGLELGDVVVGVRHVQSGEFVFDVPAVVVLRRVEVGLFV